MGYCVVLYGPSGLQLGFPAIKPRPLFHYVDTADVGAAFMVIGGESRDM